MLINNMLFVYLRDIPHLPFRERVIDKQRLDEANAQSERIA